MTDFTTFFQVLGFPAAVSALAMIVIYRVGIRLVDRHISTLEVVEKTQLKIAEAQGKQQEAMKSLLEITNRILTRMDKMDEQRNRK